MTERQKEFIDILEKIGEAPKKKRKPEEPEWKKLTKSEKKMLMEACCMMQSDAVETAGICTALNALIISIVSVIVATTTLVVSVASADTLSVLIPAVCVAMTINALAVILFVKEGKKVYRKTKKADRYRDARLFLLALSEEEEERDNEPQRLEDLEK